MSVLVAAAVAALAGSACNDESSANGVGAGTDADVGGTWLGSLTVAGAPLRIVFNFSRGATGKYAGTLDVPEQGLIGGPVSQIDVTGRHVSVGLTNLGATFIGDVAVDGASIGGTFSQLGQTQPLTLTKQPGPIDYGRPQDPAAPYPYETADVTFTNEEAGITLAGTLTWPRGAGPIKAVVLVAGSGPNDRNEQLLNHRPFLVLADALTRSGIATLRYDKRGVGASSGDYVAATSLDFADDAQAAVRFLRAQTRFPVSAVGLVGHSEGGLIAPLVADVDRTVAFLVLLAGPGVRGEDIIISQQRAIAAAKGETVTVLDTDEAVGRRLFACFHQTSSPTELDGKLRAVLTSVGIRGAEQNAIVAQLNTPWMRFFALYDPVPVLGRTTIPLLALNGGLDLQVLPGLNLPPIQQALVAAGNQHAVILEVPGLNHLFQHAGNGSPSEYATIAETMAPEVLAQVWAWIAGL
jgi:pimeloyl-ACP methyl ester carboxylesterase